MERSAGPSTMQLVRDRIRGAWEDVEDADIERSGGSLEKLVEMIARKTGQQRADIRRELRRIMAG